jgi:hypothetical protein
MGYTHYWDNPGFTDEQWKAARLHAAKILPASSIPVQFEYDDDQLPLFNDNLIRFNGVEGDGHETFYLEKTPSRSFGFCKTAQKPYDEIVVAMLVMLSEVNLKFTWSSDGDAADHVDGIELFQRAA